MKINNKTKYETRALRNLFKKCVKELGLKKPRTIDVVTSKYRYCKGIGGLATIGGSYIKMKLPKLSETEKIDVQRLARVFIHECHHNMGMIHKEMTSSDKLNVDFVSGLEIPIIVKNKLENENDDDKILEKYNLIKKRLKKHKTRQKRINNIVKKLDKSIAYYEKKYDFINDKEKT